MIARNKKNLLIIIICVLSVIAFVIVCWLVYHLSSAKNVEQSISRSRNPSDYSFWLETPKDYLTDVDTDTVLVDDSDTELVIDFRFEQSESQ